MCSSLTFTLCAPTSVANLRFLALYTSTNYIRYRGVCCEFANLLVTLSKDIESQHEKNIYIDIDINIMTGYFVLRNTDAKVEVKADK